jgi:hypothetical protein
MALLSYFGFKLPMNSTMPTTPEEKAKAIVDTVEKLRDTIKRVENEIAAKKPATAESDDPDSESDPPPVAVTAMKEKDTTLVPSRPTQPVAKQGQPSKAPEHSTKTKRRELPDFNPYD